MKTDEGVKEPRRATDGSLGYDFFAPEDIILHKDVYREINTGVYLTDDDKLESGKDFGMLIIPRSGLGFKHGVRLRNTVGLIDSDYRGEIRALLTTDKQVTIKKGEAFMQGIIIPKTTLVNEIKPTEKRKGGFGSTDKNGEIR